MNFQIPITKVQSVVKLSNWSFDELPKRSNLVPSLQSKGCGPLDDILQLRRRASAANAWSLWLPCGRSKLDGEIPSWIGRRWLHNNSRQRLLPSEPIGLSAAPSLDSSAIASQTRWHSRRNVLYVPPNQNSIGNCPQLRHWILIIGPSFVIRISSLVNPAPRTPATVPPFSPPAHS